MRNTILKVSPFITFLIAINLAQGDNSQSVENWLFDFLLKPRELLINSKTAITTVKVEEWTTKAEVKGYYLDDGTKFVQEAKNKIGSVKTTWTFVGGTVAGTMYAPDGSVIDSKLVLKENENSEITIEVTLSDGSLFKHVYSQEDDLVIVKGAQISNKGFLNVIEEGTFK